MELTRATAATLTAIAEELRLMVVKRQAANDPKPLINEIRFYDPSQADNDNQPAAWIEFRMYPPEGWQPPIEALPGGEWEFSKTGAGRLVLAVADDRVVARSGQEEVSDPESRQLGITLLACAYCLWLMLYRPGSHCVAYSLRRGRSQEAGAGQLGDVPGSSRDPQEPREGADSGQE